LLKQSAKQSGGLVIKSARSVHSLDGFQFESCPIRHSFIWENFLTFSVEPQAVFRGPALPKNVS
jgi:hypothetical protein